MGNGEDDAGSVTRLLIRWRKGDERALETLLPLVYRELRRLARIRMRGEAGGHTLQPTALIHEAYLRLVDLELDWRDRTHFLSMASRAMRRVLVDHARAKRAGKRGGGAVQVSLHDSHAQEELEFDLLQLHSALESLARNDSRAAGAIEMHYFGGLGYREIAEVLEVSETTVERDLRFARSWLSRQLGR